MNWQPRGIWSSNPAMIPVTTDFTCWSLSGPSSMDDEPSNSERRRAGCIGDQVPAVVRGRRPGRSDRPSHHPGAPGQVRADARRVSGRSFSDHPGTAEPHQRQRRSDLIPSGGETAVAQQLDVTNASSRSRHGVECCATVYFARVSLQRIRARAPGGTDHPIASTSVPAIVAGPEPQPACHVALQPGAVRGGAVSCARRRSAATGAAQRFGGEIQLSRPAGG